MSGDNKFSFKQMGEWTQTLSHTMHEMDVRMYNHIANDPNLAAAITRSTDEIKEFIASRYGLNGEMPDNVNWLLQMVLHRVMHTLIEANMNSLTTSESYEQPHPYEIAPELEELVNVAETQEETTLHEQILPGVYLDLRIALTPQTVGESGKLKAAAYTGVITAMNLTEEESEPMTNLTPEESATSVHEALYVAASVNDSNTHIVKEVIMDFLNELDGAFSIAFVRETLVPPQLNPTNEVPTYPFETPTPVEPENATETQADPDSSDPEPAPNEEPEA